MGLAEMPWQLREIATYILIETTDISSCLKPTPLCLKQTTFPNKQLSKEMAHDHKKFNECHMQRHFPHI